MKLATCLRSIRRAALGGALLAAFAAAADPRGPARVRPYQPLLERNRITLDVQRLHGSPESRELRLPQRASSAAPRPLAIAKGRDRTPLAASAPRWEMLDFCPERGFYPDVKDCPAGWQRVRVDVGP